MYIFLLSQGLASSSRMGRGLLSSGRGSLVADPILWARKCSMFKLSCCSSALILSVILFSFSPISSLIPLIITLLFYGSTSGGFGWVGVGREVLAHFSSSWCIFRSFLSMALCISWIFSLVVLSFSSTLFCNGARWWVRKFCNPVVT